MSEKNVAILTGGGDAPGLNAAIRAVTLKLIKNDYRIFGLLKGWKGAVECDYIELDYLKVRDTIGDGGTLLMSSRTNPYKNAETSIPKIKKTFEKLGLHALIAIGGEDTLGVAARLSSEENLNIIGLPKTIDNDLSKTDYTFGFYTAVNRCVDAIDNLWTTARSHRRAFVVEVMGRHAGWVAAHAGMASGADYTLVPERDTPIDKVCESIKRSKEKGRLHHIIVVSEGAKLDGEEVTKHEKLDEFGHVTLGGVGERLAKILEERTGIQTRHAVLGHVIRGGPPSAFDRILGHRCGTRAANLVMQNKFGVMVAIQNNQIVDVPLSETSGSLHTLPDDFLDELNDSFD